MELDMRHSKAGWSVTPPSVRDKKIRRHAGDIRRLLARNREYVMEEAPLPQVARPVMYHHWSPVTFLHWRYPSAVMQFLLSPELTAERSGGAAWVRLASFSWRSGCGGARRSVAVEVRGINVRTYVRDGRRSLPGGVLRLPLRGASFRILTLSRAPCADTHPGQR
jgi:uncharacterized protein YqjF (DUF2071 family)